MKFFIIFCLCSIFAWAGYIERAGFEGRYPELILISDANHDGNLEVYNPIYTNHPDSQQIFVREFDGYQPVSFAPLGYYAIPWDISDINQNGLLDIVTQATDPPGWPNGYLRIYEQSNPNSYPDKLIAEAILPGKKAIYGAQYTDLDQDGKEEVLMAPNTMFGGGLRVYEWDNGQLNLVWEYVGGGILKQAVADFNGNGRLEIAVAEVWAGSIQMQAKIFECTGDNSFAEIWHYQYNHEYGSIGTAHCLDFDGDSHPEFLTTFSTQDVGYRFLIFGYENGTYQLLYDLGEYTGCWGHISCEVGDFDRDGCDEFIGTLQTDRIRIYDWTPNGINYFTINQMGLEFHAADFDHDKWLDFYALVCIGPEPPNHAKIYEYREDGIEESLTAPYLKQTLEITPNIGKIFQIIDLSPEQDLEIYDSHGAYVGRAKAGINNLGYLPNGIYFVKTADRQQTVKITVIK